MEMSNFGKTLVMSLVAAACAVSGVSNAQERVISSDDPAALAPPRAWDCSKIHPEYQAWLEAGNTPETWRYVGPTYSDVADGTRYQWGDWLEWYDRSCPALAPAQSGPLDDGMLIGGVVGALVVTGALAGSGGGNGGNDSPG